MLGPLKRKAGDSVRPSTAAVALGGRRLHGAALHGMATRLLLYPLSSRDDVCTSPRRPDVSSIVKRLPVERLTQKPFRWAS